MSAYRLFSNKTYLFLPNTILQSEKGRIETLSHLNGLGLIYFDLNKKNPNYVAGLRAQRFSPDMFYVNDFVEKLRKYSEEIFQKLFG